MHHIKDMMRSHNENYTRDKLGRKTESIQSQECGPRTKSGNGVPLVFHSHALT